MIKFISFIFIFLFSVNSYAEESQFQVIKESFNGPCEYITEDKKQVKLDEYIYSNLCASVYKTNIDDLDKAYYAYKEYLKENARFSDNILIHLPEKAPDKRKDKNKIHLRFIYNDVDFNLLFLKKEDGIYVYDYTGMWHFRDAFGEGEPKKINDKLTVYDMGTEFIGKNLISKDSNLVIKNAYGFSDNVDYIKFIVNTSDMDMAYNIIREYVFSENTGFNKITDKAQLDEYYPPSLEENKATKYINDDYVTTELLIGVVDMSIVELKRVGDKIIGFADIPQP